MYRCLQMVQPGNFLLSIRAKPGARTSSFTVPLNPSEEAVEVRVAAPPVEGAANEELVSFIEDALDAAHRRATTTAAASAAPAYDCAVDYTAHYNSAKGAANTKKGKGNTNGNSKQATLPLPTKIRVAFHSGMTSRSKVLALELPCESVDKAWALLAAAAADS